MTEVCDDESCHSEDEQGESEFRGSGRMDREWQVMLRRPARHRDGFFGIVEGYGDREEPLKLFERNHGGRGILTMDSGRMRGSPGLRARGFALTRR